MIPLLISAADNFEYESEQAISRLISFRTGNDYCDGSNCRNDYDCCDASVVKYVCRD